MLLCPEEKGKYYVKGKWDDSCNQSGLFCNQCMDEYASRPKDMEPVLVGGENDNPNSKDRV